MKTPIILASQSAARRRLLARLGFPFETAVSGVDEEALKAKGFEPRRLVLRLAREKARVIAEKRPKALVIGSDQILVFRNRIYGKPQTEEKAVAQLLEFSGRTVSLLTAVCVTQGRRSQVFIDETCLKFRRLTGAEARDYVKRDQPLECAGSFKFEETGIALFDRVETADPTAIEGLPLVKLNRILRIWLH